MERNEEIKEIKKEIESIQGILKSIESGEMCTGCLFYYGNLVSRKNKLEKKLQKLLSENGD